MCSCCSILRRHGNVGHSRARICQQQAQQVQQSAEEVAYHEDRDSVLRPKFDGLHDGFVETMSKISAVLAVAEKTARENRSTKPSSRPRRKRTIEEELWKRAYWHLVAFDRVGSMLIGRPCCSREEE